MEQNISYHTAVEIEMIENDFARSMDTGDSDSSTVCTITLLHTDFVCLNLQATAAPI